LAQVTKVGRSQVELAVLERREIDREFSFPLVLGVALPKGERQKWLVEKATELGVSRIVPLKTGRSVAEPGESAIDRLRRSVIEASKQCGRNRLLEIVAPQELAAYLATPPEGAVRWFAHPGDAPLAEQTDPGEQNREVFLAIGPEGGFTADEAQLAFKLGWQAISLGPRILRVETAAIALCSRCL
jgi:16S rRNA (uracil1498-N3)-methyltransferase